MQQLTPALTMLMFFLATPAEATMIRNTTDLEGRARAGETAAQRELADCYRGGCAGIPADPVQACAWRIVL